MTKKHSSDKTKLLPRMKSKRNTYRINAVSTIIISGAIIAVGISMLMTNSLMTTPFIMGIAVSILGVAIILLAQRSPIVPENKKLNG